MTERQKRFARWSGYPLLGGVVFVFALHFSFPYERLRDRLVQELSKDYDVGIAEIGPGFFPGRFTLRGLTLTTRPANDSEKPKTIQIDRVDLSIGLLALLGKTISVDIDATLGQGRLVGNVETSSKGLAVELETQDISLETLPGVALVTFGAPIQGPLVAKVKLQAPQMKWSQASGAIDISCPDCTIGDGVTKVTVPGSAFASAGLTLPRIKLGQLVAKIQIDNGIACVVRLDAHSADGDLSVEGGAKLADSPKDSQAQLYTRLRLTEEFKKSSARNDNIEILFGTGVRGADGFSSYQLRGPLFPPRWMPARTPPPPMKECVGVAQPTQTTRPLNHNTTAPSIPVATPPTATVTTPLPAATPPPPPPGARPGPLVNAAPADATTAPPPAAPAPTTPGVAPTPGIEPPPAAAPPPVEGTAGAPTSTPAPAPAPATPEPTPLPPGTEPPAAPPPPSEAPVTAPQ